MPANTVNALAQTDDGYLWVGTAAGLARFDGVRFTTISLSRDNEQEFITALAAGGNGTLWVGCRSGKIVHLRSTLPAVIPPFWSNEAAVTDLVMPSDGALAAGTSNGLMRNTGDTFTLQETATPFISSLAADARGNVWAAEGQSIDFVDREGAVRRTIQLGSFCEALAAARDGSLWIGTHGGLFRYSDGRLESYMEADTTLHQHVKALLEDHDGNLWVGTTEALVRVQISPKGLRVAHMPFAGGVTALTEDREGCLWIGAVDGLHRMKNARALPWGRPEGVPGSFTPSVTTGSDGHILIFSSGVTDITSNARLSATAGPSFVAPDGSLWICTTGAIVRLRGTTSDRFGSKEHVPSKWISTICADNNGIIITPDSMGVQRWSEKALEPYRFRDGQVFSVPFYVMVSRRTSDGTVWMGTYDGLWQLKDGEVTRYTTKSGVATNLQWYEAHPQSTTWFHTVVSSGMSDSWISDVCEANGALWLGSMRGGLIRFRNGQFTSYTPHQGLPTGAVFSVVADDLGNIWIGTPIGVFRLAATELEAIAEGSGSRLHPREYSTLDGLRSDECLNNYKPAACKSIDGRVWFATRNGVVCIDPRENRTNPVVPLVHVEGVIVDGASRPIDGGRVVVGPDYRKFDIQFSAPSLATPERVRFRYRLAPYDTDWVETSAERVAHYSRLKPGKYTFSVIACNDDGVWNERGAAIVLQLRPMFYETGWFAAACVGLMCGAGFGAHSWRVRHLRRRERELEARVDLRTRELSEVNENLRKEIAERERAEAEVARTNRELLIASRKAGMAEVAEDVLHNVGNALNSVNVSANLVSEMVDRSAGAKLGRVVELIQSQGVNLPEFFGPGGKGANVPRYLNELAAHLNEERVALKRETHELQRHISEITALIAAQKRYAGASTLLELVDVRQVVEDATRAFRESFHHNGVLLELKVDETIAHIRADRYKLLQILLNLLQFSEQACRTAEPAARRVQFSAQATADCIAISVAHSGATLHPDQLREQLRQRFAPEADERAYQLHSAALFAKSIGGTLEVTTPEEGSRTVFTLMIPQHRK